MADLDCLADIFLRVRDLVALPDNDFAWSGWADAHEALRELDAIINALNAGRLPDLATMSILFAPTGPIQELSLSSGWGNRFLALAAEFDAAIDGAPFPPP